MSYIGNQITQQSFTGGVDQYNGNNSNTVFGLTRTINTVYDIDAYVENVWQRPTTGYTVSANTITFTSAPPAGSNNVVVVYRNFAATSVIPQQGSVVASSLSANLIPSVISGSALSGITTLAAGNTTITGTANVSQDLVSNTLTVSTNTATFGTTAYYKSTGDVYIGASSSPSNSTKLLSYTTADQSGITINATNASQTNDIVLIRKARNTTNGSYNSIAVYDDTAGAYRFQLTDGGNVGLFGGQIKFPASQNASSDANTLDDYEEGTWTPTLFHTNSNNASWGSRVGYYVKIGGIVHCWWLCDGGNSGTAGSGLKVSGLPFTTAATNLNYGTGGIWGTNGSTLSGNHFINAGSNLVQLFRGGNEYTEQQSFGSGYFTFRVA